MNNDTFISLFKELKPKESLALKLVYFDDMTHKEASKFFLKDDQTPATSVRVRQIENHALRKLRHPSRLNELIAFFNLILNNPRHLSDKKFARLGFEVLVPLNKENEQSLINSPYSKYYYDLILKSEEHSRFPYSNGKKFFIRKSSGLFNRLCAI
jgi:hypothetical protein